MNLKDLSKINIKDLQRIDVNIIKDWLKSNPNNLIRILLIIATIFATIYVYRINKSNEKKYLKEIVNLEEKTEVLQEYKTYKKTYDEFISSFPTQITDNDLVNKLAEFASFNNVRVESFSPAKKYDFEYMKLTTLNIDITTGIYENIVLFIKDIEESPYSIRIENIRVRSSSRGSRRGLQTKEVERVLATVAISAVTLNAN